MGHHPHEASAQDDHILTGHRVGIERAVRVGHLLQAVENLRNRDTHLTSLHSVENLLQGGRCQIPRVAAIDREAHGRGNQAKRQEVLTP